MLVLVTGSAGFIGSHTVDRLLEDGHTLRDASPHYNRMQKVQNRSASNSTHFSSALSSSRRCGRRSKQCPPAL
jgi:nucleoside-diphosphate-sugar epimerase